MFLALFNTAIAQEKFTISGVVSDAVSNETLIGVSVYIESIPAFTTTNEYGFYSITLPKGEYKVTVSHIGYLGIVSDVSLTKNSKQNFYLTETGEELKEVIITEKTTTNTQKAEMSVNKLAIATIKKMPVVLGEVDIIKSILLLPGVTNAGEGASGFNVRGGGADQNLILLDEATIFNSSHVFGFFSVFNPDAIKDLK